MSTVVIKADRRRDLYLLWEQHGIAFVGDRRQMGVYLGVDYPSAWVTAALEWADLDGSSDSGGMGFWEDQAILLTVDGRHYRLTRERLVSYALVVWFDGLNPEAVAAFLGRSR